jgi:hypothetical protein
MWQFESFHDSQPVRFLENFLLLRLKCPQIAGFSGMRSLYGDRILTAKF